MTEPAPPRRLYRSRTNRMLGGVAGGLAEYLQVDSALVRLAFVALVLAAGAGFLGYIIAWIVIPEEPAEAAVFRAAAAPTPPRSGSAGYRGARLLIGAVLVVIGVFLLLDWALPDLHHYLWPAAIIVLGLGLLAYGARR
jgi:phage shock protein C